MTITNPLRFLVAGVLTTSLAAVVSAAVVYDNTNENNLHTSAFRTGLEYGDEIFLVGAERFVTQFVAGYYGDFLAGVVGTGRIRFYLNDGTDAIAGPQTALRPKTLLWESEPFPLLPNNQQVVLNPNVLVPDSFTWTILFSGLDNVVGNGAALSVVDPVQIGGVLNNGSIGSYDDFWIKNTPNDDSWALNRLSGGTVPSNFYARVTAVPEPSILALGVVGVASLWLIRRRKAS